LQRIKAEHGPAAIAGISSARCTNDENYLMQKFIRAVIGTNDIDCCARVCHSPTAFGMQLSFGTGAATNSIEDIQHTSCILVIGASPTEGHPVTGSKIKQRSLKGVPLIVIDPRRIELVPFAKYHLQLRPGTNVAMLNMFARHILDAGLVDQEVIEKRCENWEAFQSNLLSLDLAELEAITGVSSELARAAAIKYASADAAMSFHGLGVTENQQGSKTVMYIANLAMMTGNIGRPGVGVNPLRGQNNVQGAADMGCQPHQGAGYFPVTDPAAHESYEAFYGAKLSDEIGYKIPEMFEAAREGNLKALWLMGEDVVQTDPDSHAVAEAMNSLDFLVVQEIFFTETAKFAVVVLPASRFLEKSGTFTNGERRVQRVKAGNQSTRTLHGETFKRGLGKFHFFPFEESHELTEHGTEYPLILTRGRILEHYNCGTMTRRTGNALIVTEDYVAIHPQDASDRDIGEGDFVSIKSACGEVTIKARITEEIRPGVVYTTFHFPEAMVNNVTGEGHDEETLCPECKVVAVEVEKVRARVAAERLEAVVG